MENVLEESNLAQQELVLRTPLHVNSTINVLERFRRDSSQIRHTTTRSTHEKNQPKQVAPWMLASVDFMK
ncbi:unnamed protein product [Orchesella dallaii]|uniref:Uncharacterized protein n=1 Tax=Orchesella dallaii TaxID=48710 RepID=A0ABP1R6U5_9HEXA